MWALNSQKISGSWYGTQNINIISNQANQLQKMLSLNELQGFCKE